MVAFALSGSFPISSSRAIVSRHLACAALLPSVSWIFEALLMVFTALAVCMFSRYPLQRAWYAAAMHSWASISEKITSACFAFSMHFSALPQAKKTEEYVARAMPSPRLKPIFWKSLTVSVADSCASWKSSSSPLATARLIWILVITFIAAACSSPDFSSLQISAASVAWCVASSILSVMASASAALMRPSARPLTSPIPPADICFCMAAPRASSGFVPKMKTSSMSKSPLLLPPPSIVWFATMLISLWRNSSDTASPHSISPILPRS
mmetsp:Transcript_36312/g.102303  ORF Transcript_36312/g.102303 Transcript_36312/m.102303 type:complete len:268 (-) Transcript_36312:50-853(-)